MDETARRYSLIIRDFKAYDKKRKIYCRQIENQNNQLRNVNAELKDKVNNLNQDNVQLQAKIDELLEIISNAKPLIAHPTQKAYLYGLIDKAMQNNINQQKAARIPQLEAEIKSLKNEIKEHKEMIKELRQNIHNLHCGLPVASINKKK